MAKPKNPKKLNGNANVTPVEAAAAAILTQEAATTETSKPMEKKAARKPTLVRSEARATLLPINVDEEIRRVAYLLSERRGFEPGHETEDWLTAEQEVRERYHQHSA